MLLILFRLDNKCKPSYFFLNLLVHILNLTVICQHITNNDSALVIVLTYIRHQVIETTATLPLNLASFLKNKL